MDDESLRTLILTLALKNAVKFAGKPNKKAIMGMIMAENEQLRSQSQKVLAVIDEVIEDVVKMNMDLQKRRLVDLDPSALEKKEAKEEKKKLPDLPNVSKYEKVVMRLAPYPSGALHIGNARMVVLNDEYVKRYNGELILFFDDTIGSPKALRDDPKAKYVMPESYKLIEEGLNWLGVKYSKVYYKSERMDIFYEFCEKLIMEGMAYVCFCTANDFRENYKLKKQACPHRDNSIKTNLREWKSMLEGKYRETEAVVRLKTGMEQKDPALRDQIIMRISEASHPIVGNRYLVWPMLEFSWAIDDHLIGVTHILRGADLVKEDFIEDFIWNYFKWPKIEFLHYGRLNFPEMKLSKTQARNNIEEGIYDGWDDPRTWSLQSLAKRGIRPEALRASLLDLGMSISGINFSVNWLYAKNKDLIDEISDRYFFVEDPISLEVINVPRSEYISHPLLLPTKPEKGHRTIVVSAPNKVMKLFLALVDVKNFKKNEILRLKDLMNIKITQVNLKKKQVKAEFHSHELNREYPIIQWVPMDGNVQVSILKPDGTTSFGYGEINLRAIPLDKPVQFERYGFVNPRKYTADGLFCYYTHY
jgi:glutamyl-tRNA synthetase